MPERLIREGILESDSVNNLSPEAELFYRRIMSVVDDFGRFEWDLKKIRLRVYGYRFEFATDERLKRWMAECQKELIDVYEWQGKSYLQIRKFNQRLRAAKSKHPGPDGSYTYKENGGQVPVICQADARHPRSEAEAEAKECTRSQQRPVPEPFQNLPTDHETQIASRIQSRIVAIFGREFPIDPCRPAAQECIRFNLPVPDLMEKILLIASREWAKDPNWAPKSDGWVKTVVTEEARRLGKIHSGEVEPDPPPAGRSAAPRVSTIATGGRIVGMHRVGKLKMSTTGYALAA